jgi:hypothetical protein
MVFRMRAERDSEHPVESIIAHKNVRGGQPLFKVHWEGYASSADTWEPVVNLECNIVFHAYCRAHSLERLIPDQFR